MALVCSTKHCVPSVEIITKRKRTMTLVRIGKERNFNGDYSLFYETYRGMLKNMPATIVLGIHGSVCLFLPLVKS